MIANAHKMKLEYAGSLDVAREVSAKCKDNIMKVLSVGLDEGWAPTVMGVKPSATKKMPLK